MSAFKILYKQGNTRVGRLETPHGIIETPNFIPIGTQASVKALSSRDLEEIGVSVVLANTYHLSLRPGAELIKKLGGLHKFMSWNGPVMTDSGGFQVFSLGIALEHGVGKLLHEEETKVRPRLNRVREEGVEFRSHLDGSVHILTPEKSIEIQNNLGADLAVAFDDLESPKYSYDETLKSLELTKRWGLRSKATFNRLLHDRSTIDHPLLYGVTHGGVFKALRIKSAKFVDKHFEGVALGGAHKDRKTLYQVVEWTVANISEGKPRHLLGIGEIEDLFECIERGVDLFDCVAPTRRARHGSLYVSPGSRVYTGKLNYKHKNFTLAISDARFKDDKLPVDPTCRCLSCQRFSRAYIRHLYLTGELLYFTLASYHNVYFITKLLRDIRDSIKTGEFRKLKSSWLG